MNAPENQSTPAAAPARTVHWIIAILLAVIAIALWTRPRDAWLPTAMAQNQPLAGARGVFAFTGPLGRDQYGLFMLDVDQGTLWCYAFDSVAGTTKLRLIAARTWLYDRYLQDFNCASPDFRTVQKLVSQQRSEAARGSSSPEAAPGPSPAGEREKPPPGP